MKETKLKERLENAFESFFYDEHQFENSQLVFNDNSSFLETKPKNTILETFVTIINIFRQIFLFLPGALYLFIMPMTVIYFSNQIGREDDVLKILFGLLFGLSGGSFLTLVGIGSIRNTKNLVVPASIISFSFILGILLFFFPEPLRGYISMYYSIYLFPIALITAGFAKIWVDSKSEETK